MRNFPDNQGVDSPTQGNEVLVTGIVLQGRTDSDCDWEPEKEEMYFVGNRVNK